MSSAERREYFATRAAESTRARRAARHAKRRPGGSGTALESACEASPTVAPPAHERADDTPRCRVCGHPLTARQSIALELGPVCAHRLAQRLSLAAGAPVVLGERDGELLAWIGRAPA